MATAVVAGGGDVGGGTDGSSSEPEESVSDSGTDTAETDRSSKDGDCGCSGGAGGGMVGAWAGLLAMARRRRMTRDGENARWGVIP